jgi:type IV secretion system protein VirB2
MFKASKVRKVKKVFSIVLLACRASLLTISAAEATSLPWEAGLNVLKQSIQGPVAQAIALIAIVAAGAALIFGGDMTGFMRTAVYVVLVIGLIMGAAQLLTALGPSGSGSSALLPFLL